MAIDYQTNTAVLQGTISVEDAEPLLEWLQKSPTGRIDLAACTHLHAANLQVLMAARARIASWPVDTNLRAWLMAATGLHTEETP